MTRPTDGSTDRRIVRNVLWHKFRGEQRFRQTFSYLIVRYGALEERMVESFRYVECDPANRHVFSYEYGSILRDAGSIFTSTLDRLVKETNPNLAGKRLDIWNYRKWLKKEVPDIHMFVVPVNYPREDQFLLPLSALEDEGKTIEWWAAYNKIKHSDVDEFREGNFENALNSVAALAVLYTLMDIYSGQAMKLFHRVGPHHPMERVRPLLFFRTHRSIDASAAG